MKKTNNKQAKKQKINIMEILNNPKTLIIVLIIILIGLFISIIKVRTSYKFYSGQISYNDMAVAEIHYYTEPTMTYFFANNAVYAGEDKDIYGIDVKYVVYVNGEEKIIDESKEEFNGKQSLTSSILLYSKFKTVDLKNMTNNIFTKEVKRNINTLKLIIDAKTTKDGEYDINLKYDVSLSKLK